ncbi:MAG: hypothetical protein J5854_05440 [Clostridia bacterium]|nr:hypothetical protein [Clostridia bacterium]
MKRRHYRIHYNERTQPLRRVRHHDVPWDVILLVLLALLIAAGTAYAIYRWVSVNGVI